jgi:site-specific recombinase XerD
MSSIDDYDAEVKAIRAHNQPILDEFRSWLKQSGLSEKTISNQVSDIDFFTEYLVYYDPVEKLDEADCGDVHMFLADWFPRKALWASATSVKSYLTSFKKFFRWMGETGRISPETVADVLTTLKENRDEYFEAVSEW